MSTPTDNLPRPSVPSENSCLSCGTRANMKGRRYCSVQCRQRLRHQLNLHTGLLKAINARFATFYFTREVIVMDVLRHSEQGVFSYIYPRRPGRTPGEDFSRMANVLGNAWWDERRRTNKKYLASRQVLARADRNRTPASRVRPIEERLPRVNGSSLIHLKLNASALDEPDLAEVIKKAYRRQAKKHHPDLGGDSAGFRKIQSAYETLMEWSQSPSFIRRRGFPDRWFYEGHSNRWIQPTPLPKSPL